MFRGSRSRSLLKADERGFDDAESVSLASSSGSFDRFCAQVLQAEGLVTSPSHTFWDGEESTISVSTDSSPVLGCPQSAKLRRKSCSTPKIRNNRDTLLNKGNATRFETLEVDMMKELFAKLLLGGDMSGGQKGMCSALALSNAITNLGVSIFGELWRLEPVSHDQKARWQREMAWLLSVSDHIVEFVPSTQTLSDGRTMDVMVTRPRLDLHINLPALRKLDAMLLEALDNFTDTEFWYVQRAVTISEDGMKNARNKGEKLWLPTPKLPPEGLSAEVRKQLQQQQDVISQILKAACAINAQTLVEMEVPAIYQEALPKNGRSCLGEAIYQTISSDCFSPNAFISAIDPNVEYFMELINRAEAAIHVWRQKLKTKQIQAKDMKGGSKSSWSLSKDNFSDVERRAVLADKAESVVVLLRQEVPSLPQSILDMSKIQYNKDVGQAILESYSRILKSLAVDILLRIDDVFHADCLTKRKSSKERDSTFNGTTINELQPHLPRLAATPDRMSCIKSDTFPEVIGPSIDGGALGAAKQEPDDRLLGSYKHWSHSHISVICSPPSRD